MADRISERKLRAAFHAFRTAYAAAGLHTVIRHPDEDVAHEGIGRPWVEYRAGALDLVLNVPSAYSGGSITVEPWHNPVAPQRWSGASGSSSCAITAAGYLGDTMREAYNRVTGMTSTLWAIVEADRENLRYRDSAALVWLVEQESGAEYVDARDRDEAQTPRISDARALDLIQATLSGQEWSSDTAPAVADVVALTGRPIADLDEPTDDEQ